MEHKLNLDQWVENKFGDVYCPDINHLTFDKLPADTLFERDYAPLFEREDYLFVVVGSDSGLFYNYAKQAELPKNLNFVFIEKQNVIDHCPNLEGEVWEGRVRLVNEQFNFGRLLEDLNGFIVRRRIMLIKSFAVLDASHDSVYARFFKEVDARFTSFISAEFNSQSAKVFEVERLYNLAHNLVTVRRLEGSLEGCDAIIIGGGPTLDESIKWIKQHQSKLVIFAAARVARRMAAEGIVPDFFVTVDPFPWSYDNSKAILNFSEQSILVSSFHAQHRLVSQWRGPLVFAGERFIWKHEGYLNNITAPGPTVTNAAMHIAVSIGATRLFLAGIDFCFAGGKTHESGSQEAQLSDIYGYESKLKVEDNLGNMSETNNAFMGGMEAMQASIASYLQYRDIAFINLGSQSAKMKNVRYLPTTEIQLLGPDKTITMLNVQEKIQLPTPEALVLLAGFEKELTLQLKRFKKLSEFANDALKLIPKIYDKKTDQLRAKPAIRISKLKKKVLNLIAEDGDMLVNYQAAFFADTFKHIEDETNMVHTEVVEQLDAFFTGLKKSSGDFSNSIEKGLQRVRLRINEFDNTSKPCQLYKDWLEWQELGRAYDWKKRHADVVLDAKQTECLQKAIHEFEEEFSQTDHKHTQMLRDMVSNVATLYQRAEEAYRTRNVTELRGLYDHASSMEAKDVSQKASFVHFVQAMGEELEGDVEEAVDIYLKVEMPFFRRIALNKVLNIKIKQEKYDEALLVLEALCGYSLDFMLPYADMLNLLGNRAAAMEVLGMYISQKPKAIDARIKLAQWQIEANQTAQAQQTLNQVIDLNPENKAAAHLMSLFNHGYKGVE